MAKQTAKVRRRREIWKKTNGICAHCGRATSSVNQTIDHFIPKLYGGGLDRRNLMPLCRKCNENRKAKIIDARTYYKYASDEVIEECNLYKLFWNSGRGIYKVG